MPAIGNLSCKTKSDLACINELSVRWKELLKAYAAFWLHRSGPSTPAETRMMKQRAKSFEDYLERLVHGDHDFEVVDTLKVIIEDTYNEDLLQEIFQEYLDIIEMVAPSYSGMEFNYITQLPSVKFFSIELLKELMSKELRVLLDL
ncbi:MAG TPA: hypothetical protein VFO10_02850 [Oligoflexus sp.]|uniref:hypothetical protein n=1 Tax=Oligoflexus sp. TaxID=1971216 RepID=UPI002D7EAFD3|nr:hypothetical protein [Oligoflexus sp.]HET9236161.1 hypothetical protein [Oligoflexus sp.]